MTRPPSSLCLNLIRQFEGLSLTPIRTIEDGPNGLPKWQIGYGHSVVGAEPPPINQTQADGMLYDDLLATATAVDIALSREALDDEFDAFLSLAYNIGTHAFAQSTVCRLHNQANHGGAAAAFLMWDKATVDGQLVVEPGLAKRRAIEAAVYAGASPVVRLQNLLCDMGHKVTIDGALASLPHDAEAFLRQFMAVS